MTKGFSIVGRWRCVADTAGGATRPQQRRDASLAKFRGSSTPRAAGRPQPRDVEVRGTHKSRDVLRTISGTRCGSRGHQMNLAPRGGGRGRCLTGCPSARPEISMAKLRCPQITRGQDEDVAANTSAAGCGPKSSRPGRGVPWRAWAEGFPPYGVFGEGLDASHSSNGTSRQRNSTTSHVSA